jgi:hypothetical protein
MKRAWETRGQRGFTKRSGNGRKVRELAKLEIRALKGVGARDDLNLMRKGGAVRLGERSLTRRDFCPTSAL